MLRPIRGGSVRIEHRDPSGGRGVLRGRRRTCRPTAFSAPEGGGVESRVSCGVLSSVVERSAAVSCGSRHGAKGSRAERRTHFREAAVHSPMYGAEHPFRTLRTPSPRNACGAGRAGQEPELCKKGRQVVSRAATLVYSVLLFFGSRALSAFPREPSPYFALGPTDICTLAFSCTYTATKCERSHYAPEHILRPASLSMRLRSKGPSAWQGHFLCRCVWLACSCP
ncbi:hypothetical protein B0J12DRAFT_172979 [Macrophomina phaseolina]|uniref:Transmembrane protein n=1 Tax=Macrophomina phaseolina TaxID=35725 RepID=A0ABQ8GSW0_9PEZI|nr:hypothetical protein B0J12DRAFT_172979 [Macrophomina phaseolina]